MIEHNADPTVVNAVSRLFTDVAFFLPNMYGVTVAPMLRDGIPKAHSMDMGTSMTTDLKIMFQTIVRASPNVYNPRDADRKSVV